MKFRLPWFVRLPLIVTALNIIPIYLYIEPYMLCGSYEYLRDFRLKGYQHVRYKKKEDVKVHTEESNYFYQQLEEGNLPQPLYSSIPTAEEINDYGLYVIGRAAVHAQLDSE